VVGAFCCGTELFGAIAGALASAAGAADCGVAAEPLFGAGTMALGAPGAVAGALCCVGGALVSAAGDVDCDADELLPAAGAVAGAPCGDTGVSAGTVCFGALASVAVEGTASGVAGGCEGGACWGSGEFAGAAGLDGFASSAGTLVCGTLCCDTGASAPDVAASAAGVGDEGVALVASTAGALCVGGSGGVGLSLS
jgi:hypothetical protein